MAGVRSGPSGGGRAAVFAPLPAARRADAVVRRLSEGIRLGLLVPDEQLPSESELAESFGVSAVTVREALTELRGQGLVTTRRGRNGGSFVREHRAGVGGARSAARDQTVGLATGRPLSRAVGTKRVAGCRRGGSRLALKTATSPRWNGDDADGRAGRVALPRERRRASPADDPCRDRRPAEVGRCSGSRGHARGPDDVLHKNREIWPPSGRAMATRPAGRHGPRPTRPGLRAPCNSRFGREETHGGPHPAQTGGARLAAAGAGRCDHTPAPARTARRGDVRARGGVGWGVLVPPVRPAPGRRKGEEVSRRAAGLRHNPWRADTPGRRGVRVGRVCGRAHGAPRRRRRQVERSRGCARARSRRRGAPRGAEQMLLPAADGRRSAL